MKPHKYLLAYENLTIRRDTSQEKGIDNYLWMGDAEWLNWYEQIHENNVYSELNALQKYHHQLSQHYDMLIDAVYNLGPGVVAQMIGRTKQYGCGWMDSVDLSALPAFESYLKEMCNE